MDYIIKYIQIIVNVIVLTVIIITFLGIIFNFSKDIGSFSLEADDFDYIDCENKSMQLEIQKPDLYFTSNGNGYTILLDCQYVEVNGKKYSNENDFRIKIEHFDEKYESPFTKTMNISLEDKSLDSMIYVESDFQDANNFEIVNNGNSHAIKIEPEMKKEDKIYVWSTENINLRFSDLCTATLYNNKDIEIPIGSCNLISDKRIYIYFDIDDNITKEYDKFIEIEIPLESEYILELFDIKTNVSMLVGSFYFFNTAKLKEYNIKFNKLEINSFSYLDDSSQNEDKFDFYIKMEHKKDDKNEINYRGSSSDITIGGFSIFPRFMDWFKDNIYIIPSMILTVFGGAITLTVNHNKIG